jgi:hypothetical protein
MARLLELRTRLKSFLGNDDGIMAIVFALCLPVFVVVAALAIDMGYSYWKRNIVQVDASVSALAGAGIAMDDGTLAPDGTITFTLIDRDGDGAPDNDDTDGIAGSDGAVILLEALDYAEKTIGGEGILHTEDVLPGHWDRDSRVFTSAGTWDDPVSQTFTISPMAYNTLTRAWTVVPDPIVPLNAVMTTTRRADDGPNTNPLPLFLAAAVGMPDVNINTEAIAAFVGGDNTDLDACITALNRSDPNSFYINGTGWVWPEGCDIEVYSSDDCAIRAVGIPVISVVDGTVDPLTCDTEGFPSCSDGAGVVEVAGDVCDTPNVNWTPGPPEAGSLTPPDDIPFGYLYPPGSNGISANCLESDYCGLFDIPDTPLSGSINRPPSLADGGPTDVMPDECVGYDGGSTDFHEDAYDENGLLQIGTPGETTVFCGGISVFGPSGSTVEFAGNIVISGGEFEVAATVAMTSSDDVANPGMGVYLMDEARVNLHGSPGGEGAGIGLVAQASGPLANFVFFEDPNSDLDGLSGNLAHSLRGTPDGAFAGALFFQNSTAEMKGTAESLLSPGPNGGCTVLIADKVYFNGTTEFSASLSEDCSENLPPAGLGSLELRLYF